MRRSISAGDLPSLRIDGLITYNQRNLKGLRPLFCRTEKFAQQEPFMSQPQTLGKYQIQGILGKGAMGVVYKGFDPNIARVVAIKTIHASLLDTDMGRELLNRFRNEAQAVGRLNHANIVAIYEFDQEIGTTHFVMEFVEGQDLKSLQKDGRKFTPEEAVNIVSAILTALAYTHQIGRASCR